MSSDNEDYETNYGIDGEFAKSFGGFKSYNDLNPDHIELPDDDECFPKEFDNDDDDGDSATSKNSKAKKTFEQELDGDDEEDQPLEDLMALIESENKDEDEDQMKPAEVKAVKRDVKAKETPQKPRGDLIKKKASASPAATKPSKKPTDKENFLTEEHREFAFIKSSFSSDTELHMRIAADFGKYQKLSDLWKRAEDLKAQKDLQWFTIGIMGSKSEPKTSAKGNSYIIWNMYDVSHLETGRDVSLFLFGNSYKKFWKSGEFEVFIIKKPDLMDDLKKDNTGPSDNKYSKNGKARDNAKKISISIRSEQQLELLGVAKDLSYCQAFKRGMGETPAEREAGQRCKYIVNVSETKFCIFHCKQMSKDGKEGASRFSMDGGKMKASYGDKAASGPFPRFADSPFSVGKIMTSSAPKVDKKALQQEALMSLSGTQYESKMIAQIAFKSHRANDREMLAKLGNENIDEDELKKMRLMPKDYNADANKSQKQIKSLFNSKLLLPSKANSSSVNVHRLLEMKDSAKSGDGGGLTATQFVRVTEKYQSDRKNSTLSTMSSHRDIVKKLKKKAELAASSDSNEADEVKEKEVVEVKKPEFVSKEPKIKVGDFLKQTVSGLGSAKKLNEPKPKIVKKSDDFDLEIFIGEEKTTKKLMDFSAPLMKKIETLTGAKKASPGCNPSAVRVSVAAKRKLDEVSSPNSSFQEEKEKKLRLIDDLINIKSNYDKDANDPAKNAHLKSYLDRLEMKEQVDNKLASVRTQEVKVVTCGVCNYTYFNQSEFCRNKKHDVRRHTAIQRYFKCKICSKRTFTLNKVFPTNSCDQCGSEKYEACNMRDENIAKNTEKMSVYGD